MSNASIQKVSAYTRFARLVVGLMGALYCLIGVALIFFPVWFFQNIGNFSPFNRHYEGDLGAFTLALGIGLVVAMPTPARYPWVVRIAALASMFHAANHVYDALILPSVNAWVQTIALLVGGLLLVAVSMERPYAK